MSDATKVLRVWARAERLRQLADDDGDGTVVSLWSVRIGKAETPALLLPIEDGALRVGDMLFRWGGGAYRVTCEFRTDSDPAGEWYEADPDDLWDLLMDAVEGVEP